MIKEISLSLLTILPTIILASTAIERLSYNKWKRLATNDQNWNLSVKVVSSLLIAYALAPSASGSLFEYAMYYLMRFLVGCIGITIGTSLQSIAITGGKYIFHFFQMKPNFLCHLNRHSMWKIIRF